MILVKVIENNEKLVRIWIKDVEYTEFFFELKIRSVNFSRSNLVILILVEVVFIVFYAI